ncbi:MAG: hypothetical protein ACRDHN_09845 [Thermomicrobiales bacterium]
MAIRKEDIDVDELKRAGVPSTVVISPGDRLRAVFAWLEEGAPGPNEDDGLEEFEALLNEGRVEGNKIVLRQK